LPFAIPRRPGRDRLLALSLVLPLLASAPHALQAAGPATAPSHAELAAYADALLSKTYPADRPGAAVIVVRDGEVVLRKGYGLASVELGVPMPADAVFEIASVTKPFTAVAVLKLVERGKVRLEDEITQYLPDYPTHDAKITIEELLTHTSGVPSYTETAQFPQHLRDDLTLNTLLARFKDKPLDFPPGTRWSYSDSGYVLLGAVIEKASGMSYGKFLQEEIFKPAGMASSRYGVNEEIVPRRVDAYERTADGFRRARYLSLTQGYSAGAILSTVDDLAAFDRALGGDTLLQAATRERMLTPKVLPDGTSTRMGLSWSVTELAGRKLYEHNGGIYGFSSHILRIPEEHLFIAILSNDGDGAPRPETNAFFIAARALGKTIDVAKPYTLDEATLAGLVGSYRFPDEKVRTIRREGGKLFLQRPGTPSYELQPIDRDELVLVIAPDNRLQIVRGEGGKVTGIRILPRFGPEGGVGTRVETP
jgi:CubicO group peptidase (beta-lactamase class C family)